MSENSSNPSSGQYDPGWNDPPKLQYNSTAQTGKTKLNLNKRIAFPLHGTATTSKPTAIVQPSPSSLPLTMIPTQPPIAVVTPMPQCNRIPPVNSSDSNSRLETSDPHEDLPENAREYCVNTFQGFVSRIQNSTNIRSDEVQRRINLMNQMWLSGTLSSPVHRKLFNIAKALEANNFNDAIENHRALVVDHSNVCTAWAAALRQIILTIQDNSENPLTVPVMAATVPVPAPSTGNILVPAIPSDTSGIGSRSDSPSYDIQNI